MNRIAATTAATAVLLAVWATGAVAHHSYGVYDSGNPITLIGVIREVHYEHPHVEVRLDVAGRIWTLDLPSPSRAQTRGLTREFLQTGRTITVIGWPHRDGRTELAPTRVTFEDTTIRIRS